MNNKYVEMDSEWSKFEMMLISRATLDVVIWVVLHSARPHTWKWILSSVSIDSEAYYAQ